MSLTSTHKEYITEQITLEFLKNGVIPTSDNIEDALAEYMEEHPNLEEPVSKTADFSVDRGTSSSASKIQEIAEIVSQDVGVVTREIYKLVGDSGRFYDRWSAEMKRLSGVARKLEQRVDSLLLLTEDTLGFFAHVGDVFADLSKVDTDNTTARVNVYEGDVSLNPGRNDLIDGSGGAMINITGLTENDVSFVPLTKTPGIAYFTTNDDNALHNIFMTDNSTWVGRVISSGGEMVCELKAHIASEDLEISKVSFEFTGPTTTKATVSLQYSADGYTWNLVPTAEATKMLVRNMSWTFPLTTIRWLKFIFRKHAPDNPSNEYVFSASHMKVFGNIYDDSTGDIFVSTSQQALNTEEEPILFSLVALDVCQDIPTNTGIDHYVSASKDGNTWTDWTSISPSDSEDILSPKIINLGGSDWKDNKVESETTRLDDTVDLDGISQMKLVRTFNNSSLPGLLGYRFKDDSFAVVNTAIVISGDEDPDPIGNSVVVWRNTRYKDTDYYPDTTLVRGVQRGWGLDGGQYSCFFEVVSSDGVVLDFGDRKCTLDDQEVSGVINVPTGVHKFSTESENWFDISDGINALPSGIVSTEEQLKAIDPLYPYNHKLIIEGFPYLTGTQFKGERIYRGTDISAEFYTKKVSLFDLENNVDTYGYFAVRGVGNESNPTLAVVSRFDASNPDYSNELFLVKWRSGATDASMYSYIKLKSELWTKDTGITPSLQSYRLKLGV
jgi:hypothetical protein